MTSGVQEVVCNKVQSSEIINNNKNRNNNVGGVLRINTPLTNISGISIEALMGVCNEERPVMHWVRKAKNRAVGVDPKSVIPKSPSYRKQEGFNVKHLGRTCT